MRRPRVNQSFRSAALLAVLALAACTDGPTVPGLVRNGTIVELSAVAAGAEFVAVGSDILVSNSAVVIGDERVITARSTDGVTWEWFDPGLVGGLLDVAHGAAGYIAVGSRRTTSGQSTGIALRSVDGRQWQELAAPDVFSWSSITYGNGHYMAAGYRPPSSTVVARSPDGVAWTIVAEASMIGARVAFAAGRFHIVGETNLVHSSPDGQEWTTRPVPEANRVAHIAEVRGRTVGSALHDCCFGEVPGQIYYYTVTENADGAFTVTPSPVGTLLNAMADNGTTTVGLSRHALVRSPDLVSWSAPVVDTNIANIMLDLTFAHGRFVAVGRGYTRSSTDGVTWSRAAIPQQVADRIYLLRAP